MKFFKTSEEKRIDNLKKEKERIQEIIDELESKPIQVIKKLLSSYVYVQEIKHDDEDIRVEIANRGFAQLPLQDIAMRTGYFVLYFREKEETTVIVFSTLADMKRRDALPEWP